MFECKLVQKISKNGQPYECLEIEITPNYKKVVFLTPAEKALIESMGLSPSVK